MPEPVQIRLPYDDDDDRDFAAKFIDGDATDSAGNTINGDNVRYSEPVSLIGPGVTPTGPAEPPTGCNHMNPALIGKTGPGAGATGLAPGYTAEAYAADMAQWRRSGGGRSMSEQEMAIRIAKQNIGNSFPRG